jgi:flagellar basal-body rod protein FlgC
MFGSLDISASALTAQRTRLETIAANMANANSIYDADGNVNPYRRRFVVFAPGDPASGNERGVHVEAIEQDPSPFRKVWDPGNEADVDGDGYVEYPNIDPTIETINALEASRAYEANVTAAQATKQMIQASLRLLA